MDIQRAGTKSTPPVLQSFAESSTTTQSNVTQTRDQLEPYQNEQSSTCCLLTCLSRIWACITDFFRRLFGSAENTETTDLREENAARTTQQSSREKSASPSQQAKAVNTTSLQQAQKKLEEGIYLGDEAIKQLEKLMPKIKNRETDIQIVWFNSSHLVFTLPVLTGNFVLKMQRPGVNTHHDGVSYSPEQMTEQRFANMIKAQEVCMKNNLDLLVIPHAKKYSINDVTLIAEDRLDISSDEEQEELYKLSGLEETIKQLAIFIANTGFCDVTRRNTSILDRDPAFQGSRRIALIDLADMRSAVDGFYGSANGSCGLIYCLFFEKQIDIALAIAERYGIVYKHKTAKQAKDERMKEIQEDQALQVFYAKNGILDNPGKPIEVQDLATLGLNLEETATIHRSTKSEKSKTRQVTLKDAAEYVIAKINKEINKEPYKGSVKVKRSILLSDDGMLRIIQKEREQKWPWQIINALVKQGHLFKLVNENGHGYFIQA